MNAMPNLHGELKDVGLCPRTVKALVDTHADGREKVAAVMPYRAASTPLKDSSKDWNTWIVICVSTILVAVVIVMEFLVLPR